MYSSAWGAGEKEKVDFLIIELLEPASRVDAVQHADRYRGLFRNRIHYPSLSSIAVLVGAGSDAIVLAPPGRSCGIFGLKSSMGGQHVSSKIAAAASIKILTWGV